MNGRRLLMSAVLGAVALGVGYVWGPHEYKQWQIALAREATLNGEREVVIERYETLTQRYPEDRKLQLEYLAALLEDGQTATAMERWEPMLERSDLEWDERMQLASIDSLRTVLRSKGMLLVMVSISSLIRTTVMASPPTKGV